MKHDMYQVLKIAQERFWAKKAREAVTRVDNMKSVSPFTQFKYECMAVMSELHACAILKEVYPDRDFAPQAASHGGRPDFGNLEVKADERDDSYTNVNVNSTSTKNSTAIVKFQTNLATGVSLEIGWNMTEEFFQDAKFNERPNGRSYYSGPVPRTTRGWVEYA
jgi:hypothetical protein